MLAAVLRSARDPRGLAAGRAAVGVTMVTRPQLLTSLAGVPADQTARTSWVVQMLGAREIALGLGALSAPRDRRWALAGVLSDAVDAVAVGAAVRRGSTDRAAGGAMVAVAAAATLVGLGSLRR